MSAVGSIPSSAAGPPSLGPQVVGGDALRRIESIRARFEPTAATATDGPTGTDQDFSRILGTALGCTCCGSAGGAGTVSGPGAAGGSPTPGSTGDEIAQTALEYLGVPYVWGGDDPATGLDCSGLVQQVLGRVGVTAPRVSAQQATMGTPVASLAEARPGDLLAFGRPVDHIGIYLGGGRMVHAPHRGEVVRVDDVGQRPLTAIRRVTPSWAPEAVATTAATTGWGTPPAAATAGSVLPAAIIPQVRRFEPLFVDAGRRWGIEPALLAAQCQRESAGDLSAVSSAGAVGIMQFMPSTAAARGVDPHDPASAIDGAARYLAEMRSAFGGSIELAIAAYAAGPGAVRRAGNAVPSAQVARYIDQVLTLAGGVR